MILKGKYADAVIHAVNVDSNTLTQIRDLINCDVSENSEVHIMPDCHAGKGCTIGTTMTITDRVCPNLVGVDIGCNMTCITLPKNIKIDPELFLEACKTIPSGVAKYSKHEPQNVSKINKLLNDLTFDLTETKRKNIVYSIGTLGSGNHFIELNEGNDNQFIVIHTGSRNLGLLVCNHHMEIAKQDNPRNDLSFLKGEHLSNYFNDMKICQTYSELNHMEIANNLCKKLYINNYKIFSTMHNYIDFNDAILRKGAISTQKGNKVLIPFNMRDGSIISIGKGNKDWNFSGPHGAGRIMSRSQAKQNITLEQFKNSMKGIVGTINANTIDEAPDVYKKCIEIEKLISETVDIKEHLKVLANYKGF